MDMYNDNGENEIEEPGMFKDSHKFRYGKLILKILKWCCILIIVAVYAIIFLRIGFAKVPSELRGFTFTDSSAAAYTSDMEVLTQDPYESQDENGYYQISDAAFCKELNEAQLTVRYNSRNTINKLMTKYNLTERPTGETFVYILRDDSGKVYTDYSFASATRPMNEFRRLIFTGVDFTAVETLYLDVYYGNDVSTDAPLNVTFTVYEADRNFFPVKIKSAEATPLELRQNPAYISNLSE